MPEPDLVNPHRWRGDDHLGHLLDRGRCRKRPSAVPDGVQLDGFRVFHRSQHGLPRRRRSESSRARFDIVPARRLRFGRGHTGAGLRLSCGVCGHPTDCGLVHVQ
jgi:hypothetical protein